MRSLKSELQRVGYSQEEAYFNELDKELIQKMRKKKARSPGKMAPTEMKKKEKSSDEEAVYLHEPKAA